MTAPVQVGPSPRGGGPDPSTPLLTSRRREVLQLVANGNTNKMIADALGITEHTVKTHVKKILRRLHVDDRAQAVAVGLSLEEISRDAVAIPRALVAVQEDA